MFLRFLLLGMLLVVILFIYKSLLSNINRRYRLHKKLIEHKKRKEHRRLERLLKQNIETVKKLEIK